MSLLGYSYTSGKKLYLVNGWRRKTYHQIFRFHLCTSHIRLGKVQTIWSQWYFLQKPFRPCNTWHSKKNEGTQAWKVEICMWIQESIGNTDGWHCMDDMLKMINLKWAINSNSTTNRHRVASIFSKLELPEFERQLIYKHFGHSERINQTVCQALPGSLQLHSTGKHLMQINLQGKAYPKKKASAKWQETICRKSKRNIGRCEGKIISNYTSFTWKCNIFHVQFLCDTL